MGTVCNGISLLWSRLFQLILFIIKEDSVHFITNRTVQKHGSNFSFDETSNELSNSIRYCKLTSAKIFTEILSGPMMQALKENSTYKEILFYIHGFNNQPSTDIFPNARILQEEFDNADLGTLVVPIIWPCDNDLGVVKDYWDDQKAAKTSGEILSRTLSKLLQWQQKNAKNPCLKRMHILAHSMGNRVLMHCMDEWRHTSGNGEMPYLFNNIFMMAADVPNEVLERDQIGQAITMAARRVLCYYANDDLAMTASKVSNVKNRVFSRRLGHTGPESMAKVPDHVYALNCDRFNNNYDSKGHSYFLRDNQGHLSPALLHMMEMIQRRTVALEKRNYTL
jgi:esterase/lipase superfamily enzyme